jgi:glycosyltransferase involved in cell wall biosynthesis
LTRRVLHLIPTLQGGGAEYQLALLARALPALGWSVSVGYVLEGVHEQPIASTGAHLHRLKARGNYDPARLFRVIQLIRRERPAIVQTWLPQMDVVGGIAARVLGLPWIVAERSSQPVIGRRLVGPLRDRVQAGATAVISNSAHALLRWESRHPSIPRFLIPNAIPLHDLDAAAPSTRMENLRREGPARVAIAVGRLVGLKRIHVFIDAMRIVADRVPAYAVICGEGTLRQDLERRAREAGLGDRIVFAGFVGDVIRDIKAADVLVSLSEYEGRPNAVIEAMVAGTPVVLSDIPEHREVVGGNGLFVDGADPSAVAEGILQVFADREAAVQRAEAARRAAEVWDLPHIAAQYAAVYEEVLKLRGRAQ